MLEKIDLKILAAMFRKNNNDEIHYEFVRAPFLEEINRGNCTEIIKTNNLVQVLTAMAYHNDFQQSPVQIDLKVGMNLIEFITVPTVRLIPSIFEKVRAFTYNKKFYGVWASNLRPEAKLAYEQLCKENNIDSSLKSIFRDNNHRNSPLHQQRGIAIEIKTQEYIENMHDSLNDNFIIYLLSECNKNNGDFGLPLSGWRIDEIENCKHFSNLKKVFNRVFLVGSGEEWQSSHLIVMQPKIQMINNLLLSYR
ncbi:hypothetical protein [Clostridium akagii]|uniref:hypothetical protein n=1 Tax=Clostridium akagii TaxID=91623 RepID=UPI00047D3B38|nr:hypothetical protein [Clostridium akagii]